MSGVLQIADTALLIDDLEKKKEFSTFVVGQRSHALLQFLAQEAPEMANQVLTRATRLSIYPDTKGNRSALTATQTNHDIVMPCEESLRPILAQTGLRLLDAESQGLLEPFLELAHVHAAGLEELVVVLQKRPALSDATVETIQKVLVGRRGELAKLFPVANTPDGPVNAMLNSLPLWKTRGGKIVCAAEVVEPGAAEMLDDKTPEREELEGRTVTEEVYKRLKSLAPMMVPLPRSKFFAYLVDKMAQDGKPLSEQPRFLSSVGRVSKVCALVAEVSEHLPRVDAAGKLRFSTLYHADASTHEVLAGLPVTSQLLHPEFESTVLSETAKKKDQGPFNPFTNLFKRFMATPQTLAPSGSFPAARVLLALLDQKFDDKRRSAFYRWMEEHERD
ncbi:MAG: hypothetical protein ACRD3W_05235, partial [Terriglobales bacterium]